MKKTLTVLLMLCLWSVAIGRAGVREKIIVLDEGNWQNDNGRLSYFEDGHIVSNRWFSDVNGSKLGDTPNDIIQINDSLLAISVNWSNIIQFIRPDGKAVAATEDVPNNRCLATDGRYVYVTSYGHECNTKKGIMTFTKGFVAQIDINTFQVVNAVEVGYEPEGIAYYNGHLFVANSGGYSFQEDYDYETTVSVVDVATMKVVKTIDTGCINLYGGVSQIGKYLCINSVGDYYYVDARGIIFDCQRALDGEADCFAVIPYAVTNNTSTQNGKFMSVGSRFSYITGETTLSCLTIDPVEVMESKGATGVNEVMPGTMISDIKAMGNPYDIYVNPYTGYIYATDASSYNVGGVLYQWTPEGELLSRYDVYINPGHLIALPPDGETGTDVVYEATYNTSAVYDVCGRRISNPIGGLNIIRMKDGSVRKVMTK